MLFHLDADAIRNVGKMSQARMNPYDFVVAYESGSSSAMHCFYQQAKRLILLQELYKQLCFAYHENTTDISKNKARSNI